MSKGSKRRPAAVPRAELERRWERVFGESGSGESQDTDLPGLVRDPMLDEAQEIIAAERERYLGAKWPDNGIRARITDITAPE